jgi:hypothetical protein
MTKLGARRSEINGTRRRFSAFYSNGLAPMSDAVTSAKSSSSMMTPFFANLSCDPFTLPEDPCVLGTYVQYAVNVSRPVHIYKTLAFVKEHNIRFVVRNTGHE